MHKTKNTYLFEREYDKENSGVVDEALKKILDKHSRG